MTGRSSRLFEIIQILRGARAPIPARTIAAVLEVTKRTVYREPTFSRIALTLVSMTPPYTSLAGTLSQRRRSTVVWYERLFEKNGSFIYNIRTPSPESYCQMLVTDGIKRRLEPLF
jgi:HTH domain